MNPLCPECMGDLVSRDGQSARCTIHGGQYRILFSRGPFPQPGPDVAPEPPSLAPGAVCRQHAQVAALALCGGCGVPICATCAFIGPDGRTLCPPCATQPPIIHAPVRVVPAVPQGVRCVQHPHLAATRQCQACGAFMCATCAFELPGGIHVCPTCAVSPKTNLSPRRKKLVLAAYLLAALATCALAGLLVAGATGLLDSPEAQKVADTLFGFLLFTPSLIGTGLAFAAKDRRLRNPPALWGAVVWNVLILGSVLLLMVIGLLSGE